MRKSAVRYGTDLHHFGSQRRRVVFKRVDVPNDVRRRRRRYVVERVTPARGQDRTRRVARPILAVRGGNTIRRIGGRGSDGEVTSNCVTSSHVTPRHVTSCCGQLCNTHVTLHVTPRATPHMSSLACKSRVQFLVGKAPDTHMLMSITSGPVFGL
jgi:hypothetical protein